MSDSTGAVVSGVEVKLTNTATGEVRTTVTTPAGTYRFPALPIVGTYTLEVSNKGFKSVKVQNVIASVGVVTTRDVKLEIGAASEQVTVEAGAQFVQTEDSSLSQNVDRNVWTNMPLETRSQNEFIGLLPGAEPAAEAGLDHRPWTQPSTAPAAAAATSWLRASIITTKGWAVAVRLMGQGGANTTISPDAIEEYRVIEGTPPAEFGKAGGFVTDTVLKGGTNHGTDLCLNTTVFRRWRRIAGFPIMRDNRIILFVTNLVDPLAVPSSRTSRSSILRPRFRGCVHPAP